MKERINESGWQNEISQNEAKNKAFAGVGRPIKELVGFKRVTLSKGESQVVTFEVPKDELMFWDANSKEWVFENGAYEFMLGASSQDIRLRKSISIKN